MQRTMLPVIAITAIFAINHSVKMPVNVGLFSLSVHNLFVFNEVLKGSAAIKLAQNVTS